MDSKAFEIVMASLASLSDEKAIKVLAGCARAISEMPNDLTIQVSDEIRLVIEREATKTKLTSLDGDTDPIFKDADRFREALRGPLLEKRIDLLLIIAAKLITITGPSGKWHPKPRIRVPAVYREVTQGWESQEYPATGKCAPLSHAAATIERLNVWIQNYSQQALRELEHKGRPSLEVAPIVKNIPRRNEDR
jgi:hypothetical protein